MLASAAWDWLLSGTGASSPFGDSLFPLMLPTSLALLPSALPIDKGLLPIGAAAVLSGLPFNTVLASVCSLLLVAAGVGPSWGCPGAAVGGVGWRLSPRLPRDAEGG